MCKPFSLGCVPSVEAFFLHASFNYAASTDSNSSNSKHLNDFHCLENGPHCTKHKLPDLLHQYASFKAGIASVSYSDMVPPQIAAVHWQLDAQFQAEPFATANMEGGLFSWIRNCGNWTTEHRIKYSYFSYSGTAKIKSKISETIKLGKHKIQYTWTLFCWDHIKSVQICKKKKKNPVKSGIVILKFHCINKNLT